MEAAVTWLALLRRIREIPGSRTLAILTEASSTEPLHYATTTSFHILSISLSTITLSLDATGLQLQQLSVIKQTNNT
jgi:hypothetical protein